MALVDFRPVVVLTLLVLVAAMAAAQDPNLYNAEADLEAAWGHLQATPNGGKYRKKALDHVRKALDEARKAEAEEARKVEVKSFPGVEEQRKQLKREDELERKRRKHEDHLLRKQQQREEELEEKREEYGY